MPYSASTESQHPDANHILIVDDNTAIHEDFRRILADRNSNDAFDAEDAAFFGTPGQVETKLSFDLEFASQGQEALEKVRAAKKAGQRFSVVFMDVRMPPGWDGIETAKHLWEEDPDLQIVICTAYSDYSWDDMVEQLGQTDKLLILRKPFDVIEAKQTAHAFSSKWSLLQQNRQHAVFLEQTMNLSPSMIFWVTGDGSITYANLAACDALGCDKTEVQSLRVGDILSKCSGEGWRKIWNETLIRKNLRLDTFLTKHHGQTTPVEAIVTILDFQSRQLMCVTAQDITSRLLTLRELANARDAALESARMKSQFMANMSHEIRTPMNGVLGMAELLEKTELTASQREYVGIINQSGSALLSIINDILDSAKIESGKIEFQKIPFNLHDVIKGTMQTISANASKNKNLKMCSHVDANITSNIFGDPGRLRQVLLNLVGNAVKFTNDGEVSLTVELVEEKEEQYLLRFRVKDSGIGIDADHLHHIFQPFTQADSTNKRSHGGTGLGLTISSQIIQAMGGAIQVQSDLGKGAEFSFELSLQKTSEKTTSRLLADSFNHTTNPPTGNMRIDPEIHENVSSLRILLAEDNEVNRKVTLMQLEQLGAKADIATNGREAVEALTKKDYDVILMDCQMPVMDGFEATREIRLHYHRPIRIIALTANAMKEDRNRCLKAGMDDYLSKPLNSPSLAKALRIATAEETTTATTPEKTGPAPSLSLAADAVDFERLREVTGSDEELFREISQQYLDQAVEILDDMESAIHAGQHDEICKLAHKLAGSSATCGMVAIVAPLRAIEALKANQVSQAITLHQISRQQLMRIRQTLANPA